MQCIQGFWPKDLICEIGIWTGMQLHNNLSNYLEVLFPSKRCLYKY